RGVPEGLPEVRSVREPTGGAAPSGKGNGKHLALCKPCYAKFPAARDPASSAELPWCGACRRRPGVNRTDRGMLCAGCYELTPEYREWKRRSARAKLEQNAFIEARFATARREKLMRMRVALGL